MHGRAPHPEICPRLRPRPAGAWPQRVLERQGAIPPRRWHVVRVAREVMAGASCLGPDLADASPAVSERQPAARYLRSTARLRKARTTIVEEKLCCINSVSYFFQARRQYAYELSISSGPKGARVHRAR